MKPRFKAKIHKILFKDYFSFILLLFCIALTITIVGIPLLIILLPLLIWRVRLIKKVIEEGEVVLGIIAIKSYFREWSVWYVFQLGDQIYKVRNFLVAFKLPFNEKDVLEVAYDPQKPQRAFLPILYA